MRKQSFQSRPYYGEKRRKGSMVVGILIGIVMGVAGVVGIAIYFNHASTPFTNLDRLTEQTEKKETASEVLESLSPKATMARATDQLASQPADINAHTTKAVPKKEKTKFDFYEILPGKQAVNTHVGQEPKQPTHQKQSYLQLGSFQKASEANNLKAKLALVGINVHIQSIAIPNKGLVHRVLIGPVRAESIKTIIELLHQNGVHSAIITSQ